MKRRSFLKSIIAVVTALFLPRAKAKVNIKKSQPLKSDIDEPNNPNSAEYDIFAWAKEYTDSGGKIFESRIEMEAYLKDLT